MAPDDAQKVMRRVYDANNNLIREGLVDKNVPNTREALLEFWAAQDEADAQAAAAEAEAEAQRLAALEQEPVNGEAMAIPALMAAVEQQGALLAELDQRTSNLVAAQPEETLRLASQIALAAGAAQAVEATAHQAQEELMAIAEAAQSRLDALSSEQAAGLSRVADVVEWSRSQVELTSAQVVADAKKQIAQLVTTTTARVADMRGPKGATGNPGSCTTVGAGVPEGADALMPLIERGAIKGDVYIDGADDNRRAYRWTGEGWEPGPAMATVQVRDVRVQALNTGNTVFAGGSGSGSGASSSGTDPLTTRSIAGTGRASNPIGDSLRWSIPLHQRGLPTPTSCKVAVQLTAADGPQAGKNLFVLAGLLYEPGGGGLVSTRFTEFSSLGDLEPNLSVGFNMQIQPAGAAPGGISVSVPPGTNASTVFLTIDGNSTGATRFFVAGSIEWLLPQPAVPDLIRGSIEPAWKV
ncbi:MAG: hypothetical protein RLZZ631_1285 [Cyanobacteriota bacterium]|jgi:hypothetical protein